MSLLDILLIAIVGASVIFGFLAGFARAGLGFLAAFTGMLFGFWFYGIPAAWIRGYVNSPTFANLAGFLVVFLACVLLGGLIGKLLSKLFKWTGLSGLDHVAGAGFGLVRGGVAAVAFISVLLAFTSKPPPRWITDSAMLPYVMGTSNVFAALAPRALKDAVRETVREIRQAWDDEVRKSQKRGDKAEPKSPPPKPVDQ